MRAKPTRFQSRSTSSKRKHTQRRRGTVATAADLSAHLRKIVQRDMSEGNVEIQHVALVAGLSKRTLQRLLAASGTTYSQLVVEVRLARAVAMMDDPSTKLAAVARTLGYSDAANFTRAFRKWTGLSPSQFRLTDRRFRNDVPGMRLKKIAGGSSRSGAIEHG